MQEVSYETPELVSVGDFAELTRGGGYRFPDLIGLIGY